MSLNVSVNLVYYICIKPFEGIPVNTFIACYLINAFIFHLFQVIKLSLRSIRLLNMFNHVFY